MTLYTMLVNASFAVLIALTLVVVKNGAYSPEFLLNLLYYIIVTPAIAVTLNRIMFASENEMIVADALDKTGRILSIDPLSDPSDAKLPEDNEIQLKDVRFRYPEAERFAKIRGSGKLCEYAPEFWKSGRKPINPFGKVEICP